MRYGFVNDRALAEHFIKSQINNYYGRHAMIARLLHKGITRDIINELLTQEYSDEDELERARLFCEKRNAGDGSRKDAAKLARTLAARGFPPAVVYSTVRRYAAALLSDDE